MGERIAKTGEDIGIGGNPNIIRARDVAGIIVDPRMVAEIQKLLTPKELLARTEFEPPEVITPPSYPNFTSLVEARERIRTLQLLPIKTEHDHVLYNAQPKEKLAGLVQEQLGGDALALAPNEFPHFLPDDVQQNVVWMQNPDTDRGEVAQFIARCMQRLGLSTEDVILFERPRETQSALVKPTLPGIGHVHFWMRQMSS
jgi:hypothetical protein